MTRKNQHCAQSLALTVALHICAFYTNRSIYALSEFPAITAAAFHLHSVYPLLCQLTICTFYTNRSIYALSAIPAITTAAFHLHTVYPLKCQLTICTFYRIIITASLPPRPSLRHKNTKTPTLLAASGSVLRCDNA
jgi:hypothetical protein